MAALRRGEEGNGRLKIQKRRRGEENIVIILRPSPLPSPLLFLPLAPICRRMDAIKRGKRRDSTVFFEEKTQMQYVHENIAGKLTCGKATSSFGESRTWSPSFFAISGDDGWLTRERGEEEKGLEVVG